MDEILFSSTLNFSMFNLKNQDMLQSKHFQTGLVQGCAPSVGYTCGMHVFLMRNEPLN